VSTEQPQHTRHTLLQKLQSSAGDENNWDEFVSYYEGYIYVIIRNFKIDIEDSEDLLQEVLIKVWKSLPSYNYDKDKCRFRTWLCVVIRNTVYNFLGRKNSRQNISCNNMRENLNLISEAEIDAISEREWKNYIANMAWENLKGEFNELSRQIFEASLDETLSNAELAERFDVAESSVRVYKMRVRNTIYKEIVRLNDELGG
jgi:RNA polymerase sigma factor (sigma-70 family)